MSVETELCAHRVPTFHFELVCPRIAFKWTLTEHAVANDLMRGIKYWVRNMLGCILEIRVLLRVLGLGRLDEVKPNTDWLHNSIFSQKAESIQVVLEGCPILA